MYPPWLHVPPRTSTSKGHWGLSAMWSIVGALWVGVALLLFLRRRPCLSPSHALNTCQLPEQDMPMQMQLKDWFQYELEFGMCELCFYCVLVLRYQQSDRSKEKWYYQGKIELQGLPCWARTTLRILESDMQHFLLFIFIRKPSFCLSLNFLNFFRKQSLRFS